MNEALVERMLDAYHKVNRPGETEVERMSAALAVVEAEWGAEPDCPECEACLCPKCGHLSTCSRVSKQPEAPSVAEAREALVNWGYSLATHEDGEALVEDVDALIAAVRAQEQSNARERVMRAESWAGYAESQARGATEEA